MPRWRRSKDEHRRVERDAGKRAVDHRARDARGRGLARHRADESVEITAAGRRADGYGEGERHQESREGACDHAGPHCCKERFGADNGMQGAQAEDNALAQESKKE